MALNTWTPVIDSVAVAGAVIVSKAKADASKAML
jgi:hypothetical protein